MKLRTIFTDDRAVSPVIGVILMVAITVILAAVIGTFVLGLGDELSEQTPQTSFKFAGVSGDVEVTHTGGDTIEAGELSFSGAATASWDDDSNFGPTDQVSAGDSVRLGSDASDIGSVPTSGQTLNIVWSSPSSDSTAILASYEVV